MGEQSQKAVTGIAPVRFASAGSCDPNSPSNPKGFHVVSKSNKSLGSQDARFFVLVADAGRLHCGTSFNFGPLGRQHSGQLQRHEGS